MDVAEGEVGFVAGGDGDGHGAGEAGDTAGFPVDGGSLWSVSVGWNGREGRVPADDVASAVCYDAVRGSSQSCSNAELVSHRAACDEEGGFFAC